jgi:poly-gamma-glutamate synthesis protein (capsule biosynthesis protein)
MRLFLCGDVMTGRGIDQILPRALDPTLHEACMGSALGYVALAEQASGPIPRPAPFDYIWGEALAELDRRAPDLRIVNLETSVTADGTPEPKGINYRMHPGNLRCIAAARIDCCVLANNHVLDWGAVGLVDTLVSLEQAGIATAGAGRTATQAARPAAVLAAGGARLLVFAYACPSSGVPGRWQAREDRPGVNFLPDLGKGSLDRVAADIRRSARADDAVMVSVHWGPNWGYRVPADHRSFARGLVEEAGVHIVHGHSSHHPMAIELREQRPVLYGSGDFINDYEGIRGYESFRGELVLGYFLEIGDRDHALKRLEMLPFRLHRFRLNHPAPEEAAWLRDTMDRECRAFGHRVHLTDDGTLRLTW